MKYVALSSAVALWLVACPGSSEPDGGPIDAGEQDEQDAGVDAGQEEPLFDGGCAIDEPTEPLKCNGTPTCGELDDLVLLRVETAFQDARLRCEVDSDCTLLPSRLVLCPFDPTYRYGFCAFAVRKDALCDFVDAFDAVTQEVCETCRTEVCANVPSCLPPEDVVCRAGLCQFED